ncbi:cytidine deaminase 1-like [Salvia miltiorrhiza]|uniref:cytidine deaminase 1-like n=1 Tax=Salvia miltiorrhiza TaxID=226208 RepID=UPI0025AB66B5|nr:cytidine deaminase 1-like [Salvia miltiorrhiza]
MNQHGTTVTQFVMEASVAESIAQSLNLPSVLHLLPHLVHSAQSLARPPISNFHVGAVGLGSDGRVFVGVNLEFPGVPLHQSVHAEQFLLTNLQLHRCPTLLAVAVSAAPCGHCRQFYQELRHSASLQILVTDEDNCVQNHDRIRMLENKAPDFMPLLKFLPNPFGPRDLLDDEAPLLLEQHHNHLDLLDQDDSHTDDYSVNLCNGNDISGKLSNGNCRNHEINESLLREAALEAANNAHAPYSGCPSGVALMDCEGKVYKGSYAESAAYNPSLGPVQSALVAYVARGGGDYERIVAAALVETKPAKVRQDDTARLLLKAISPKCELRVYNCQSAGNVAMCKKVDV